ncbi:MAG: undecaprenyl diphosphate synthase family protein, partial [Amnibacterium sp.]
MPGQRVRGPAYRLYGRRLRRNLERAPLPRHIAMILDGNRRWARLAGLESAAHGHRAGAAKIVEFAEWVADLRIPVITLYHHSTDNLTGRQSEELEALFTIIGDLATALSERWRVQHVGTAVGLPEPLRQALTEAEER